MQGIREYPPLDDDELLRPTVECPYVDIDDAEWRVIARMRFRKLMKNISGTTFSAQG